MSLLSSSPNLVCGLPGESSFISAFLLLTGARHAIPLVDLSCYIIILFLGRPGRVYHRPSVEILLSFLLESEIIP